MATIKRQAVLLHHFDGDAPMLSATADRREDLRASLFALHQEICAGTLYASLKYQQSLRYASLDEM
jgi:chromosome condensin MukBEF complex kleisin-like MukF subunit